jgi:hypothetical protein
MKTQFQQRIRNLLCLGFLLATACSEETGNLGPGLGNLGPGLYCDSSANALPAIHPAIVPVGATLIGRPWGSLNPGESVVVRFGPAVLSATNLADESTMELPRDGIQADENGRMEMSATCEDLGNSENACSFTFEAYINAPADAPVEPTYSCSVTY